MKTLFALTLLATVLLASCYGAALSKSSKQKILKPFTVKSSLTGVLDIAHPNISEIYLKLQDHTHKALRLNRKLHHLKKSSFRGIRINAEVEDNNEDGGNPDTKESLSGITLTIEVGTPPQKQNVFLDFLTHDFFVVGKDYAYRRFVNNVFNEESSTTFVKSDTYFKLPTLEYKASGVVGQDTVSIGNLKLDSTNVKVADSSSVLFPLLGVNGILGTTSSDDNSALSDLLENAPEQALTLYYNPNGNIFSDAANNVLTTFGGSDNTLCQDDWKTVSASTENAWTVEVTSVDVGKSTSKPAETETALILNSVLVTLVPKRVLAQIVETVQAITLQEEYGIYSVSCDTDATILFEISGQKIPLTPDNYLLNVGGFCFLKVYEISQSVSAAAGVNYVFGEPLLRSNCAKFNPKEKTIQFSTPNAL